MVYEKLLNDRQYKTIFDLVEAQPSVQDMVRYGVEDDRNLLLFVKALNEATLDFDRKKAKKGTPQLVPPAGVVLNEKYRRSLTASWAAK